MAVGVGHTLDALLAAACARITRHTPAEAAAARDEGTQIVDIRSTLDRERDGIVPGSLHIPRTVLEWRAEPGGPYRSPHLCGPGEQVILICDHGYSTILAAAALADLGYAKAGDVIGGYAGWLAAGLPTGEAPPRPQTGGLAGMSPPDS